MTDKEFAQSTTPGEAFPSGPTTPARPTTPATRAPLVPKQPVDKDADRDEEDSAATKLRKIKDEQEKLWPW